MPVFSTVKFMMQVEGVQTNFTLRSRKIKFLLQMLDLAALISGVKQQELELITFGNISVTVCFSWCVCV